MGVSGEQADFGEIFRVYRRAIERCPLSRACCRLGCLRGPGDNSRPSLVHWCAAKVVQFW